MDPVKIVAALLFFIIGVPIVLVFFNLKVYLAVFGSFGVAIVSYLWLLDKLAPSPSASRLQAKYGLHQIYPAAEEPSQAIHSVESKLITNVVFVHGLGADPSRTWNDGDICWISDFFPEDLKKNALQSCVRLFTFNYDCFWVRDSNSTRLRTTADSLRRELGDKLCEQDFVLVGHSYGGLVIKEALVLSPELKTRLKGVVFLGTPHTGTPFTRFGIIAAQFLALFDSDVNIMRVLVPESIELDDLEKDFSKHFKSATRRYYFETHKMRRYLLGFIPFIREFVVPERSATYGADAEERISLDSDHRGLNKFRNRDHNYGRVAVELLKMLQKSNTQRWPNEISQADYDRCMTDLRLTSPEDDKTRIKKTKGGLLESCYKWIIDHPDFQRWRGDEQCRLLWIKGGAGKGKTMLLIGIIDELTANRPCLSFFFCQGTNTQLNNATAVLRGLIYNLLVKQQWLLSHLWEKYRPAGKVLFEDDNAFYALSEIFQKMLQDPRLTTTYLIIDALDECETGLPQLLELITKTASASYSQVKWIVSSRNIPDIEKRLTLDNARVRLNLELNVKHVSDAVDVYIDYKVSKLTSLEDDKALQDQVQNQMRQKADGTFLWVALVCKELQDTESWNVLKVLAEVPGDLTSLYNRMMTQIGHLKHEDPQFCRLVLSTATLAYRPLHLLELGAISGLPGQFSGNTQSLTTIVNMCGSFLTVQEDHVYLIHQSAQKYLKESANIFPTGHTDFHYNLFTRSLSALSQTLRRDIYNSRHPGLLINEAKPVPDQLAPVRYSCVFWVDHICEVDDSSLHHRNELSDEGAIFNFLKKHFLHWLESLSLLHKISDGTSMVRRLLHLVQPISTTSSPLARFLKDAESFAFSYGLIIERAPLQTYGAALAFSPAKSEVKIRFWDERLLYIKSIKGIKESWNVCQQTLEGHDATVDSVAFSPDGRRLASASDDCTVRLWDAATGACEKTLEGHGDRVNAVAFSPDGRRLASASGDRTVRLWDAATGACEKTLEGHGDWVNAVAFSPDGRRLASASNDNTVRLWDATTGACEKTLEGHGAWVNAVAFSPDGRRLASASGDRTVRLWDAATGACEKTLEGHGAWVNAVAFSPDGRRLASALYDNTVRLWDAATGVCEKTFKIDTFIKELSFSPDDQYLKTNKGFLSIDSSLSNMRSHQAQSPSKIFLKNDWVSRDGQDILWIPRDERVTCSTIYNNLLALGHVSGQVTFLEFSSS